VSRFPVRSLGLLLAACCALALAQSQPTYEPKSGQEGKDVVWIPTSNALVEKMLDMAKVGPGDFVMDLGSGDGRTVIAAARRGARALGVEYNADLVEFAKRRAAQEGLGGRASFVKADLFQTDLSRASVITLFLLPDINLKLRPRILNLRPGTRIVSNTFDMGEWQADASATISSEGCDASWCTALLWIVPVRVAGTHKLPRGEVVLRQRFQMLSGELRAERASYTLRGRVRGEEVTFTAGGRKYRGRMNGRTLELEGLRG
jgi:SAM-dependent methyltransferase